MHTRQTIFLSKLVWLCSTYEPSIWVFTDTLEKKCVVKGHTWQKEVLFRPGPYFIKVKIILSLKFKINPIFYLIKEFMKHSCLNFFYEIVNKISIKVKRNWNLQNSPRLKDDRFILNPDFKKIVTFMK